MVSVRLVTSVLFVTAVAFAGQVLAATVNTKPLTPTEKNIETLGTGISIALPLTAAGVALYKDDTMGLAQLTAETVLTVGTAKP